MEYKSTRHTKYLCNYHFVWIPKYRRDLLVEEVAEYIKEVLKLIAKELGCEIIALEVMPDHIHLFLTSSPPRKGEGSLPEGSSFPPSVRVYIPHLVGSRVAQRTTPI